ncbi:MAG TPA: haloacid dehalogenase type II [Terriglobales bacterium]|nr:haloacid dehalogenase type II [Terriglobales bacterium]
MTGTETIEYLCSMPLDSIRLITFDCYGTLIDWEAGMLRSLRPLFSRAERSISDAEILEQYGEAEAELESGPYLRYRDVLAQAARRLGQELRIEISEQDARRFAGSLTEWEPFPDTVAALAALSKKFKLGIISNVDDDLFASSQPKLHAPFEVLVTAEQVRSYKPSLQNFEEVLRRTGIAKQQWLHAGQSIYHDVVPATQIAIESVWVNRPSVRPGVGAVRKATAQATYQVSSVGELARLLGAASHPHQAAI